MNQNNKNMEKIKLYTMNELLDRDLGPIGTPERDEFEQELADEELGERMGVQRSQVCRIESGKSITLASMMRAFRALGVQVALDMKGIGRLVL